MLSWIHFGDLHASDEDGWKSLVDLRMMIDQVNALSCRAVDFAFLPGDNANHGTADQYRRIRAEMDRLRLPWHAIPGDHDFEPGHLDSYHTFLDARTLPYQAMRRAHRCLFLDIVSPGRGGPDFRLGTSQTAWLRECLDASTRDLGRPIVFMHAFPGDLAEQAEAVGNLFVEHDVACVDTGHTHYNELLNDGGVIHTATRSTGQIEEGSVGCSLHCVDGSVVAWRFKEAAQAWPVVMITSPADRRLVTDPTQPDQRPGPSFDVRAKVFGGDGCEVVCRIDDQEAIPMQPVPGECDVLQCRVRGASDGMHDVHVEARSPTGARDSDRIEVQVSATAATTRPPLKACAGHERHSIGAWSAHGLLGTKLGPNRNGRKW